MLKSFFLTKKYGPYAWLILALLLAISWYTVQILVIYNLWNRDIMDALEGLQAERFWTLFVGWDMSRLWSLIMLDKESIPSFIEIVVLFTPIAVYSTWQTQRYTFKWREANTLYYLKRWNASKIKIEGASQRMQEDLMMFGDILQGLFAGLFSAILMLIYFIPILWGISAGLPIWNGQIIPGFLVWVVLVMSLGGTFISIVLAWPLVGFEKLNQVVEAVFRKRLVFSEDNFALRAYNELADMFTAVRKSYYRLFNWYMGFSVWQQMFGFAVGNLALFVLAPSYFLQLITLGVLFQALNAFSRIENSLTFFVDRWQVVVKLAAVVSRINTYDKALAAGVTIPEAE